MSESTTDSVDSNETDIIDAPAEFKSFVWQHFGFKCAVASVGGTKQADRTTTVCRICKQQLAYNGNTTNMMLHLKRHHKIEKSASHTVRAQPKPSGLFL